MASVTKIIKDFSWGITNEARDADTRYCQMVKNFDIHSFKHKLVPLRSSEVGDSNATAAMRVRNFCIAKQNITTNEYALFGLGKLSATDRVQLFYKHITLDSSNNLADATWVTVTNQFGGAGTTGEYDLFVWYERTGLIYGSRDARYIWSADPDDSGAFVDSALDLTAYTTIRQGLVHSKDDVLYVPYDNKIAKNNNGSWTAAALTLPENLRINSICEYNNYIAIGCAPKSGYGKSVVYLWDRDSSLATLSESIDWGNGELFVLEEIDGILVGVSNVGKAGVSSFNTGPNFAQRIVFRYLSGGKAVMFNEFISSASTSYLTTIPKKYKDNNYIYFPLFMTFPDGTNQQGIWKIGKNRGGNIAVSLDRTSNNDSAITLTTFLGFIIVGDFLFTSTNESGTITVRKTIESGDASQYSQTSSYDTVVLNDGDSSLKKKLVGVTVFTEPLPTAGQVILKYKIDDETSFTTIFTNTTDNSVHHSAINIESTGLALPEYKEITFQILSTGGAVITGLKYKSNFIGKDLYE